MDDPSELTQAETRLESEQGSLETPPVAEQVDRATFTPETTIETEMVVEEAEAIEAALIAVMPEKTPAGAESNQSDAESGDRTTQTTSSTPEEVNLSTSTSASLRGASEALDSKSVDLPTHEEPQDGGVTGSIPLESSVLIDEEGSPSAEGGGKDIGTAEVTDEGSGPTETTTQQNSEETAPNTATQVDNPLLDLGGGSKPEISRRDRLQAMANESGTARPIQEGLVKRASVSKQGSDEKAGNEELEYLKPLEDLSIMAGVASPDLPDSSTREAAYLDPQESFETPDGLKHMDPEDPIPAGEEFSISGASDLKALLAPFKNNLGQLRQFVADSQTELGGETRGSVDPEMVAAVNDFFARLDELPEEEKRGLVNWLAENDFEIEFGMGEDEGDGGVIPPPPLETDQGEGVSPMNINPQRGPTQFTSQQAGSTRGGSMPARKKKSEFGEKFGSFAEGVAQTGLNVAGTGIPGDSVISNAIGGASSGQGDVSTLGGVSVSVGDGSLTIGLTEVLADDIGTDTAGDSEQDFNQMKTDVREEIASLQDELDDWPEGKTRAITYTTWEEQSDGSYRRAEKNEEMSKEQAEDLVQNMERGLEGLGSGRGIDRADSSSESTGLNPFLSRESIGIKSAEIMDIELHPESEDSLEMDQELKVNPERVEILPDAPATRAEIQEALDEYHDQIQEQVEELVAKLENYEDTLQVLQQDLVKLQTYYEEGANQAITYHTAEKQPDGSYNLVSITQTIPSAIVPQLIQSMQQSLSQIMGEIAEINEEIANMLPENNDPENDLGMVGLGLSNEGDNGGKTG
jgi:hypothetical protein